MNISAINQNYVYGTRANLKSTPRSNFTKPQSQQQNVSFGSNPSPIVTMALGGLVAILGCIGISAIFGTYFTHRQNVFNTEELSAGKKTQLPLKGVAPWVFEQGCFKDGKAVQIFKEGEKTFARCVK